VQQRLKSLEESLNFLKHDLAKVTGDAQWFQRLGDIADVDKVRFPDLPPRTTNNPTAQDAGLEVIIPAYTFIPERAVKVLEVEALINALKAAGKSFEHRIYTNAPGGHAFNRLDTQFARESHREIYNSWRST
jgi:hypothetical protein